MTCGRSDWLVSPRAAFVTMERGSQSRSRGAGVRARQRGEAASTVSSSRDGTAADLIAGKALHPLDDSFGMRLSPGLRERVSRYQKSATSSAVSEPSSR